MSFARNVHFTLKTGKVDEFSRLMNAEILPLLKNEKGFCHDLTLFDRNSSRNTGMSVSMWDDRACAEAYNTKTATFPGKVFAGMFGFAPMPQLESTTTPEERQVPKIDFGQTGTGK